MRESRGVRYRNGKKYCILQHPLWLCPEWGKRSDVADVHWHKQKVTMWELFRQADQPKEAGSPFEVITSNKLSMQIWDAPSKQKSWKNQVSKQSQNSISLMASRDGNPWAETKVSQILRTALFRCFGGGSAVPNVLVHYTVMYSCRLLRLKGQWFGDARWGDTVNSSWKFTYVAKILAWYRGLVGSVPVLLSHICAFQTLAPVQILCSPASQAVSIPTHWHLPLLAPQLTDCTTPHTPGSRVNLYRSESQLHNVECPCPSAAQPRPQDLLCLMESISPAGSCW